MKPVTTDPDPAAPEPETPEESNRRREEREENVFIIILLHYFWQGSESRRGGGGGGGFHIKTVLYVMEALSKISKLSKEDV